MSPTKADLARRAATLRSEGKTYREIAEHLGVSTSYAGDLVRDPTGEKARERKERTQKEPCDGCGKMVWRHSRRDGVPRCVRCSGLAQQKWPREKCILAIREFHFRNGRLPTSSELGTGHKMYRLAQRDESLPWTWTLISRFGSVRKAMMAAGFEPRKQGSGKVYKKGTAPRVESA